MFGKGPSLAYMSKYTRGVSLIGTDCVDVDQDKSHHRILNWYGEQLGFSSEEREPIMDYFKNSAEIFEKFGQAGFTQQETKDLYNSMLNNGKPHQWL